MTKKIIPFFSVARENRKNINKYLGKIKKVLISGNVLQGNEVLILEKLLSKYMKKKSCVVCNSCTDALFFALKALKLKKNSEVLVPNFSYVASASSIVRAGLRPKFIDIDNEYNLDLNAAQKKITSRTKAMIFVHLYGQMGSPNKILEFCKKNKIILIEDVAQAFGAMREGKIAGSIGELSCISFDPTKIISAPGSGGAVLTNNKRYYNEIRKMRYHGKDKNNFKILGYNSQLPTITASVILEKIKQNKQWNTIRQKIANKYCSKLSGFVSVPKIVKNQTHAFHKFVIETPKRDKLKKYLLSKGIQTMIHYNSPLSSNPYLKKMFKEDIKKKNAYKKSKVVLSLPIHPFLKKEEVNYIISNIIKFIKAN